MGGGRNIRTQRVICITGVKYGTCVFQQSIYSNLAILSRTIMYSIVSGIVCGDLGEAGLASLLNAGYNTARIRH
jgi:hypothetical protein